MKLLLLFIRGLLFLIAGVLFVCTIITLVKISDGPPCTELVAPQTDGTCRFDRQIVVKESVLVCECR
jgi:hypothetical protein